MWPNQPAVAMHWAIEDIKKAHQILADAERSGSSPPFGISWRRDYKATKRMAIIAAILLFLLLIILAGLAIGQTLTRLLSS